MNMSDKFFEDRADIRGYSFLPSFTLRFFPTGVLERMYNKTIEQAVDGYEISIMGGEHEDFDTIASVTIKIEKEMLRRRLDRKPLNPHEGGPKVYATEVWANYG